MYGDGPNPGEKDNCLPMSNDENRSPLSYRSWAEILEEGARAAREDTAQQPQHKCSRFSFSELLRAGA
jgi:hypothetical protein